MTHMLSENLDYFVFDLSTLEVEIGYLLHQLLNKLYSKEITEKSVYVRKTKGKFKIKANICYYDIVLMYAKNPMY